MSVIRLIDSYTKESVNYEETSLWHDGTPMDDTKVDNVLYRKKGFKYYKRVWSGYVDVRWFGAVGDGLTDDTTAIQSMLTSIGTDAVELLIDCNININTVTFPSNVVLNFKNGGMITSSGTDLTSAVYIFCPIKADINQHIFNWTGANPTNLNGTTTPIMFGESTNAIPKNNGFEVSVKWFGAVGDNSTDDTASLNAAATSITFNSINGSHSNSKNGPSVLLFPRGNYRLSGTSSFVISGGTTLKGQTAGGSHSWCSISRNDGLPASMIIVKNNWYDNSSGQQNAFENIQFKFVTTIDFASSETQLETAVIDFQLGDRPNIDTLFNNCWFLGSPQKGSIFKIANKYNSSNVMIDTGSDSDGAWVGIRTYNTIFDVINGAVMKVYNKGYMLLEVNSGLMFQLYLGLVRNYSTNSSNKSTLVIKDTDILFSNTNSGRIETVGGSHITYHRYSNTDIRIINSEIRNGLVSNIQYTWTCHLDNSNMEIIDCKVTGDLDVINPMFNLSYFTNSLVIKGMIFEPSTLTSVASTSGCFIAQLSGSSSAIGNSSIVELSDSFFKNDANFHFTIFKGPSYANISVLKISNNVFESNTTDFNISKTGVERYYIQNNVYSSTANVTDGI